MNTAKNLNCRKYLQLEAMPLGIVNFSMTLHHTSNVFALLVGLDHFLLVFQIAPKGSPGSVIELSVTTLLAKILQMMF